MDVVDQRAGLLVGGELGKSLIRVVAAETDAVVLGDGLVRVALFVGDTHEVRVVAGRAAEGVGEVGMHGLLELGFDQGGFLIVAVGAGAGGFFGIRCMWVLVVAFVVAFGTGQALVVGLGEGLGGLQEAFEFWDIKAFFGQVVKIPDRIM